jgi:hypothetical protein
VSTDEINVTVQIIDGGEMYVPNLQTWETLFQTRVFQERTVFSEDMRDLVSNHLDLSRRYPEFALAFQAFSPLKESWLICMLLQTMSGPQRVHIEHLRCDVCGWYGTTANPMLPDLYLGVPDRRSALDAAAKQPEVPCPKCGTKLPRPAIWTEPLTEENA